jgi:hypothetical protein
VTSIILRHRLKTGLLAAAADIDLPVAHRRCTYGRFCVTAQTDARYHAQSDVAFGFYNDGRAARDRGRKIKGSDNKTEHNSVNE